MINKEYSQLIDPFTRGPEAPMATRGLFGLTRKKRPGEKTVAVYDGTGNPIKYPLYELSDSLVEQVSLHGSFSDRLKANDYRHQELYPQREAERIANEFASRKRVFAIRHLEHENIMHEILPETLIDLLIDMPEVDHERAIELYHQFNYDLTHGDPFTP